MKNRTIIYTIALLLGIVLLFFANLFLGSVNIPPEMVVNIFTGKSVERQAWIHIVLESRLPQAFTALFTGGAIAVSGLLLQTVFRNPLADPGILGITSGASLGVAIVILLMGGMTGGIVGFDLSQSMMIVLGAFLGSLLILGIIMGFATVVKSNVMLLIIGIMVGYLTSSIITLLKFFSNTDSLFSYTMWGMGNFSNVSLNQLPFYCVTVSIGLVLSILLMKPLNALLLGERYAANLGVNIKLVRMLLLLCAGLLTAITTAYCGPIAFIGLAVPHMVRLLIRTSNHKSLLPLTILMGAFIALLCNLLCILPNGGNIIPLNAVTPIFGAPVIIYVIINQKKIQYFN
ncbi:MAG: iron chelate uptake ABC transporter family permease subunit [Dysgonomonas sp.]